MNRSKLLYLVLFVAAGIAISVVTVNSVYGTGSLTNLLASPSTNLPGSGTQYEFNFTTSSNSSQVKYIVIQMPPYWTVAKATTLVTSRGLPTNTTVTLTSANSGSSNPNPVVMLTLATPSKMQNSPVVLFISKFANPLAVGSQTITITTKTSTNSTIDTSTATVNPFIYKPPSITDTGTFSNNAAVAGNVGIGTTSNPVQKLEVNGTVQIDGNLTTFSTNKEFKISAPSNVPICIGSGC